MLKFSGVVNWRSGSRSTLRKYSAPGVTVFKSDKDSSTNITNKNVEATTSGLKESSSLVAAAFASLNTPDDEYKKKGSHKSIKQSRTQILDSQILKASDINSLLVVAENPIVSRRNALKSSSYVYVSDKETQTSREQQKKKKTYNKSTKEPYMGLFMVFDNESRVPTKIICSEVDMDVLAKYNC